MSGATTETHAMKDSPEYALTRKELTKKAKMAAKDPAVRDRLANRRIGGALAVGDAKKVANILNRKMADRGDYPDITVGSAGGRYTVRDRGNAAANRQAIVAKAERRGYPSSVIQKRYGG